MRYLLSFVFMGALSVASMAQAYSYMPRQLSGLYVGVMAGANMIEGKSGPRSPVFKNEATTADDTGLNAGLALGFKVGDFRLAGEVGINTKADLADYQFESMMYSAQLYYEIPVTRRIMPYFNVGIGHYSGTIKADPGISSDISGMAWNVGGGLTFALNRRVSLDLGYRYTDMGDKTFKDSEDEDVSFESTQHLIYLGWRYVF
ncbi:MAG: porin family protein [Alphaproteobacteria bacterium]|nr:porin family protein [Alphaproteobacteria bacterium]